MKQQIIRCLEQLINEHRQQAHTAHTEAMHALGTSQIAQQGRHKVEAGKHHAIVDTLSKLLLEVEAMEE